VRRYGRHVDSPPRTGPRARRRAPLHALAAATVAACAVAAPGVPTGQDHRADAAAGAGPSRSPGGLLVERNLRYGGSERAVLDVYRADGRDRTGVAGVLVVHGGGWRFGDKRKMADIARALARAGFVAFNVNYSLATPSRPGFPTQVKELGAALRWIGRHAPRFGVNPRRLAALGSSAGAHLAALLATRGPAFSTHVPRLRAVVTWSAPFDLVSLYQPALAPAVASFLGCGPGACPQRRAAASPLMHVTAGDPPMLIVGSEAELVPVEQAQRMAARLRVAGVPHRLWVLSGTAHGIDYADVALAPAVAFLRRRLR
jgi:acetyl esterase/lipase